MAGQTTGALLGVFALLIGIGAIVAALRRRRDRERYPETYAASGGIFYTAVQMGCGGLFLAAGVGLITLAIIFRH
ncbi:MAG TPA: hypothetical protein VM674_04580 [Candidatus Acidoferrum sp.]|nr:hypothetical protein [Candidatus Acidoferrum sp.]